MLPQKQSVQSFINFYFYLFPFDFSAVVFSSFIAAKNYSNQRPV